MDELKLIEFIAGKFKSTRPEITKGIGDDCAVLKIGETNFVVTVDSMVEDVHFKMEWFTPEQLGMRSMAINLSDIAAMGGTPEYGLLALNMGRYDSDQLKGLLEGIDRYAREFGVDIIGGNISSSRELVITVTLIGSTSNPVMRSGAREGDLVMVTGTIGDAAAGLYKLLNNQVDPDDPLINRFLTPTPRIDEGQIISRFATSMIDISDGLQIDLWRILSASRKGATIEVEKIPRSDALLSFLNEHPEAEERILWGGEDYELLFTIPPEALEPLKASWKFETQLSNIGYIEGEQGLVVKSNGEETRITSPSGWIHQ